VWHRSEILLEKASRVSYMSESLMKLNTELKSGEVYFTAPCKQELGYSIYGGSGIDMVGTYVNEYASFILKRDDIQAERIDYDPARIRGLSGTHQIVIVNSEGQMSLWQKTFVPDCSKK